MISAWQVYLVLQLDAIRGGLITFSIAGGFIGLLILLFSALEEANGGKKWGIIALSFSLLMGLGYMLVPSSKTMAAMIILPAITSHEVVDPVAKEAGELYKLAKDALKKAVNDDEPTTEKNDNAQG